MSVYGNAKLVLQNVEDPRFQALAKQLSQLDATSSKIEETLRYPIDEGCMECMIMISLVTQKISQGFEGIRSRGHIPKHPIANLIIF